MQSDIEALKSDEFLIDDYLEDKKCDFINRYVAVLEQRISESKNILESLLHKKLDYSGRDSLYYSANDNYSYHKNKASAEKYWNKKVRFKILRKLVENDSILEQINSNFNTLEADLRHKIIDNEICLLKELEQSQVSIKRIVEVAFLDALVNYQDPNSAYLSTSDKARFERSVSNSQLTFGIETRKRKNGDIVISHISPGSAAFKNGEIEINDVVLALKSKSDTLESFCLSNETITSFINDSNTEEITFKIKKKDGQIKSVKLGKSNLDVEGNSITGYVLKGHINIGYIKIPSFYTDTESINGLGVSNDVAKQIYKLQQEQISGLILDLRFNGGGSMKEAIDLSGMFIDRGPLAISKVRNEENYTIRDPNRGSIFNKPIVILVDQFSASASEFFSAAMQDYNRALIVGSVTHGKATSQLILPISKQKDTNFLKLTMSQFFRVTGKSHQQTGVMPDITLPNIYDNYKTQEIFTPFSLSNSSVEVKLKHPALPKKDIKTLISSSKQRTQQSAAFKAIKVFNTIFVEEYINRNGTYPLSLEFVFNDNLNYNNAWETYASAWTKTNPHSKLQIQHPRILF